MSMKKTSMWIISLLLVLVTVLAGCSGNNGGDKGNAPANANGTDTPATDAAATGEGDLSEVGTLPIVKSGTKELTIGASDNYYAPASLTSGLEVWKAIEERTGIKLNWDVTPSGQYGDAMKIRLAAAKDLPDIVSLPFADPVESANQGLIIPMDDLIEKYAPNIKAFFEANPKLHNLMKAPDGKVYALSSDVTGAAIGDPFGVLIRQDWLTKLSLEEPVTPDEWYNVLKAFKEKDPNGNGKPDEIPFSPGAEQKMDGLFILGSAFDMHLIYSQGYAPDANGKIQFEWLQPKGEQFITWLSKLYKEGLIDPQFLTNGDAEVMASMTQDKIGTTQHFINNTNRYNKAQENAGFPAKFGITLPPGPERGKGYYEKYGPISGWHAITKDAKDPILAMRWMDYTYASEEGNRFLAFGIEGKSYDMVNGVPEFSEWTANNPDGLSFNEALRSLGAMPTVAWIRNENPPLDQQMNAILRKDPGLQVQADKVKDYLIDATAFGLPTMEETAATTAIMTDISTFLTETLAKYITGQEPIDWKKFSSTLESLGINDVLAAKQAQYDRFIANSK